jgi:membrane protein YqaA with SNARE-associated domain
MWLGIPLDLQELILEWGSILLLLLSCLPTPPRLAVITACYLGLPWYEIIIAVAVGKVMWFNLIVWLIRHASEQLKRIPLLGKIIMQFKQELTKEQS